MTQIYFFFVFAKRSRIAYDDKSFHNIFDLLRKLELTLLIIFVIFVCWFILNWGSSTQGSNFIFDGIIAIHSHIKYNILSLWCELNQSIHTRKVYHLHILLTL